MATIAPLAIMSPTTAAAILSFAQVKEPTTDPANDADDTATVAWPCAAALTDAMSPTEGATAAELANSADNVASVKLHPRCWRRSRSLATAGPARIVAAASNVLMGATSAAERGFTVNRIKK